MCVLLQKAALGFASTGEFEKVRKVLLCDVTTSLLELVLLLAANRANILEDSLMLMQMRPPDHVRAPSL